MARRKATRHKEPFDKSKAPGNCHTCGHGETYHGSHGGCLVEYGRMDQFCMCQAFFPIIKKITREG